MIENDPSTLLELQQALFYCEINPKILLLESLETTVSKCISSDNYKVHFLNGFPLNLDLNVLLGTPGTSKPAVWRSLR